MTKKPARKVRMGKRTLFRKTSVPQVKRNRNGEAVSEWQQIDELDELDLALGKTYNWLK